jgi:hypothetical protein
MAARAIRLFQLFVLTPGAPAKELGSIGFREGSVSDCQSHKLTEIVPAIETDVSNATAKPITIFFILPQSHRIYA